MRDQAEEKPVPVWEALAAWVTLLVEIGGDAALPECDVESVKGCFERWWKLQNTSPHGRAHARTVDRVARMVAARELGAVEAFCERVERMAEAKMLTTGKLEGAHYAAMRQVRDEMRIAKRRGSRAA